MVSDDRDETALDQVAGDVQRLGRRVHILESVSRGSAREQLDRIFKNKLLLAVTVWLEKSKNQTELAKLVGVSLGSSVSQQHISRGLSRLKSEGILGQAKSKAYFVEEGWKELGLDAYLRKKAAAMGIKVAARRRRRP